jgi:glucosamine 6-phosphate synthetase-like amidotransferase/phosphosugar isomerase protein
MPPDIYEQLLQAPRAQLVELALVGLSRQGEMLASVIDSVWGQVDDVIGATRAKRIYLTGCGDSYFAALSARYAFEQLTGVPTSALESMEFAYALLPCDSLVIAISSGGAVSMTLRAGEHARQSGVDVIGVTAQAGSQIAQELPCLITDPDLSKGDHFDQVALMLGNFSFSLAALYIAAIHIGQSRGYLDDQTAREAKAEIRVAPPAIKQAMDRSVDVQEYLEKVSDEADFYFLGAGPSYGVALFYQAKFFEQAQRPVYGVELEEFAHEQFFLLQPNGNAQLWFIAPAGRSREQARKIMGGCREMGAHLIAVTTLDSEQIQEKANLTFALETTSEMFSPLISVVPGELLGIHAFARWGGGALSAAERRDQMAISRRLTRKENIEHP